jgi:hypothetical protein
MQRKARPTPAPTSLGSKCLGQRMHGPGAMCLHTAFRATHDCSGLGNIQFLPSNEAGRLPVDARQLCDLPDVDHASRICSRAPPNRQRSPSHGASTDCRRVSSRSKSPSSSRPRSRTGSAGRHCAPSAPEPVHRGVGQDALEQQRQFGRGRSAYFSASRIIASCTMSSAASSSAHGIHRALEGALLDALEEVGEFFVGGQGVPAATGAPGIGARIMSRGLDRAGLATVGARRCAIMLLRTTLFGLKPAARPGASF